MRTTTLFTQRLGMQTRALPSMSTIVAAVIVLSTQAFVLAQEPERDQQSAKSTVLKGKAPVAKELLRVRFPKPKTFTLSNGARVFVLEDHRLPAVRCTVSMEAGTLFEPKPGVAEMTAAMLEEGTQTRVAQKLAEDVESIGATLNANATSERTSVSVSGLSEYTDQLVDLLADAMLHASFPADRLERIRFRRASQVGQRRSNAVSRAGEEAAKVLYGSTPYARVAPSAEEIRAITRDDLLAFHDRFYRPNDAIIGVSGDVSAREVEARLQRALADWKPRADAVSLPPADFPQRNSSRIYLVDRPGSAQTVVHFGALGVNRTDPDYIPLVVANRILGGGSTGRLFQNIREDKGYTYGAYSALAAPKWTGVWSASASVRTPVTEPAVKEFLKEFARLRDQSVPAEELASSKRSIVGSFARTLETPEGILGRTLEIVENGLPADYWDTYPAKIEAVTAADVQRVARKYLAPERVQLIAVGERTKIEDGLKQVGTVEVVGAK